MTSRIRIEAERHDRTRQPIEARLNAAHRQVNALMPSLLARTFAGKVVPHGLATHRCLSCSNESVRTNVREKLLKISDEIVARGHANLTRLTVPRPWFERPKTPGGLCPMATCGWQHSSACDTF